MDTAALTADPVAAGADTDVEVIGADSQGPLALADRDRRSPRFSWTPAYEATFFQSLCDSVQLGLRENNSFKAEAWERAAEALQQQHGAYPTKSHLINKSDNARKRFRLWRGLRENPDFLYNSVAKTVTAAEETWRAHIEREPLSRALRGRPFDHEDYMEILYPDVVGSGGAPKRVMKPKRRADGQVGDEPDMPGTSVLNLQEESQSPPHKSVSQSPVERRPSLMQTSSGSSNGSVAQQPPLTTSIPPRPPSGANASVLTPPDDVLPHSRGSVKRPFTGAASQPTAFTPTLSASGSLANQPSLQAPVASSAKRPRTSQQAKQSPGVASPGSASNVSAQAPKSLSANMTSASFPDSQLLGNSALLEELVAVLKSRDASRWREDALDAFFRDFSGEDLDLQIMVAENVLVNEHKAMTFCKMPALVRQHWDSCIGNWNAYFNIRTPANIGHSHQTASKMSYAAAAAKGPKQSPEEAAAPLPPDVVTNETASTSSLVDVDMPKVHMVPADFDEQSIQTETQANRIERESAAARTKAEAERAKRRAASKASKVDSWLATQFSSLSDGSANALALANLAGVVGLSSYLGYKAWALYDRGRLSWETVGLGVGIMASVGVVEAVFGGYLYKGKGKKKGSS